MGLLEAALRMSLVCALWLEVMFAAGAADSAELQGTLDRTLQLLRAHQCDRALADLEGVVARAAELPSRALDDLMPRMARFLAAVQQLAIGERAIAIADYARVAGTVRRIPSVRDPWPAEQMQAEVLCARVALASLVVDAKRRDRQIQWALADLHQLFVTIVDAESIAIVRPDLQETVVCGRLALYCGLAAREFKRGNLHGAVGRLQRARPALALLAAIDDPAVAWVASALQREMLELEAACLARSGARGRAAGILERLLQGANDPVTRAREQVALAQVLTSAGELARARSCLDAATQFLREPSAALHESERVYLFGDACIALGNLERECARAATAPARRALHLQRSVRSFEQCIEMRQQSGARLDTLVPSIALGGVLVDLGEMQRAEQLIFPLFDSIDEMRRATVNGRSTVYAFPDLPDLVESALDLLYAGRHEHPENLARAITVLERTRERRVWDAMRVSRRAPGGLAAEDARRLDELRRARAQALRAELRAPAQMLSDAEVLAERGEVFFEGLVRDYPQLFARTPDYRCDDLRALSAPADLLVYFAGPHALHVFTLTPGAACWDRTADGARVAREARFFAACLESQSADSLAQLPLGRSLAAALVPRHAALRAAGALRIVASGFVDQVPFDALPDGDGQLIVHHHATSRIPSLTVLGELANLGRLASGPVVVCEMPRIDAAVLDRFGIVPLLRRARPFLIAAQEIASEALSLERFLGLGRYAPCLVHLTTHGVIDADSGLPVLWLAGEQGALVPEDLATTRFERSVIVLQSCRSAHGLDLGGEGQVDFEKAFLGAGCLAVVDSHQPMSLKWSDRLFTAFYDALAHGHDLAESMRQARLSLIGSDASEPASAWAFPRVVGAGETEVSLPRRPAIAPLLMLAASACAVAAWWSATRRRAGAQPERGWR